MALTLFSNISTPFISHHTHTHTHTQTNFYHYTHLSFPTRHEVYTFFFSKLNHSFVYAPKISPNNHLLHSSVSKAFSAGGGGKFPGSGGGGGGGDDGGGDEEEERDRNREEAMLVLAEAGKSLESFPADLAVAVKAGRVPGSIVQRFFEMEKSVVFRWLFKFGGFKERLLADDLFLSKLVMECVVVIFTKVFSVTIS